MAPFWMTDVDPQSARHVRARISEPVWKIGIQLDRIAGARNVDATLNFHLKLPFENEPKLVALVMQWHPGARRPGFVTVLRQLVAAFGVVDHDPPLDTCRAPDDLLVLRVPDDRMLVGRLDGVQQLRNAHPERVCARVPRSDG